MRTVIRWAVVLGLIAWVGYVIAGAGWSYFTAQEIVDQVLREASSRTRTARGVGSQTGAVTDYVRTAIAQSARREGLSVEPNDVTVSVTTAGISATVRWPHPVITYGSNDLLV